MRLIRYSKKLDYSYTFGPYPTIEILKMKPKLVVKIILHTRFSSEGGLQLIQGLAKEQKIEIQYNNKLIQKISSKENCYVIGVFKKYPSTINRQNNHLVLVEPSNSGNLGTIMRSMLAFNIHDLAIIKPAVDTFNPETVRASMGALFGINFQLFDNIDDYIGTYGSHNMFPFMTNGDKHLTETEFCEPFSLIFGNESSGLPDFYKQYGKSVQISQTKKVDSLNLAISIGISLHHLYSHKYHR